MCTLAKGLQVVAANDLKAGDQLLINYGHRSDDELLLNYGFVLGSGFKYKNQFSLTATPIYVKDLGRKNKQTCPSH